MDSKTIGTLPTRLYSCEFALPGKWTCILEVDEFLGVQGQLDESLLPSIGGAQWVKTRKEIVRQEAHIGIYHHTYECSTSSPPKSQEDSRPGDLQNCVASASVSLTRTPIGMHPKFTTLKNKYGGVLLYGEWDWPSQDPTGQSTANGLNKNGETITGVNPMYGVQDYLEPTVSIRKTFMQTAAYATPTLSDGFGFISDLPSGLQQLTQAPRVPPIQGKGPAKGSCWLLTENSAAQHGNDLEITQGWLWGGLGGWNDLIYSAKPMAS